MRAVVITVLVFLGMLLCFQLFSDKFRHGWDWNLRGDRSFGGILGTTTKNDSQYLLGVGKADITGYFPYP